MAYYVEGSALNVSGTTISSLSVLTLNADKEVEFRNPSADAVCDILILQGKPINEPLAQYGPFVMNTQEEIAATQRDYQRYAIMQGYKLPVLYFYECL